MTADLLWVDAGRRYGFDDLVHWQGGGREPFAAAAARIDTVILGPHASAAFPAELKPFVNPALTHRKQCDFSDVITSSLGRLWVAADPHAVFVENPHSRLVLDPNRAPPADPVAGLRTFFQRLQEQRAGGKVSFAGIDAVRPITFSGEDVLLAPTNDAQWQALTAALATAIANGVQPYRDTCVRVVDEVLAARAGRPLRVCSLHDTMNTKMRADGAIVVERPPGDRLPPWVNFGNRGDDRGEPSAADDPVTLPGAELRRIAAAWAQALGVPAAEAPRALALNRPYKGAFETTFFGERLRGRHPQTGAVQLEFLRETLLGPATVQRLHQPGTDWPVVDLAWLTPIADKLAQAGAALRAD